MFVAGGLTVAVAVIAAFAVGRTLPALLIFAVMFVVLAGALATLAVARSRRLRPAAPGAAAFAVVTAVACVTAVGYFLAEYPSAARHLPPVTAVLLAAVLAGCLWLALRPPPLLIAGALARRVSVGAAVLLGIGLVVWSRLAIGSGALADSGVAMYLMFVPVLVLFAASALAAAAGASFRVGVQTAVWTALLTTPAVFAIGLLEAVQWFRIDARLIFAGDRVPGAAGENIRGFAWGLVLLPYWWLPFGVFGAAVGRVLRRGRAGRRAT